MPDLDRSTGPEHAKTLAHEAGTESGIELSTCVIVPSFNEGRSVASVVASIHVAMPAPRSSSSTMAQLTIPLAKPLELGLS